MTYASISTTQELLTADSQLRFSLQNVWQLVQQRRQQQSGANTHDR